MICLRSGGRGKVKTALYCHLPTRKRRASATAWHEGIVVMEETWESRFLVESKKQGHSDDFIKACLDYASILKSHNMPVIFNEEHLANLMGVEIDNLFAILKNKDSHYTQFNIRKKSGGLRELSAPSYKLRHMQRWIYMNILLREINISKHAYGFIPKRNNDNRNIKSNAEQHVGKRIIVSMDMESFFSHIYEKRILAYFLILGYEECVAKILTSLCCLHYRCPQGAPTSPMLSNIIFKPVDDKISTYCRGNNLQYTRYADDITISGDDMNPNVVIQEIKKILRSQGYKVNDKKTRVRTKGMKQKVTGLIVSDNVNVPKSYRKDIWRELYFCKKFGTTQHMLHLNTLYKQNRGFYKSWLLGRIQYVRQINYEIGDRMLTQFNSLNWAL